MKIPTYNPDTKFFIVTQELYLDPI